MPKHSRDIALLAGLVYFIQGSLGIVGVALPLYMRGLGWSIPEITAISSIAAAPWVLKIIYGLFSDCLPLFGYRRKSYLVLCGLISAAGWLALAVLPGEKIWVLSCLLVTNLGFAATDVITDGLVVEHSRGFTSHFYQSVAWGSRSIGAIFSGITGGWLASHWPAQRIFLLATILPLVVLGMAFRIREVKQPHAPFHTVIEPLKKCFSLLAGPNLRWFIVLLILMTVSSAFGVPFFFFMKETLAFSETFLGFLMSLGWAGAVIGSVAYARWLSKISPKVLLTWAIIVNCLNILSTLLILNKVSAFIVVFVGGLFGVVTILPLMAVSAMLTHNSGVEGTTFAVLMSLYNLGQIVFGFMGGQMYRWTGLHPLIIGSAAAGLLGLLVVRQLHFKGEIISQQAQGEGI